MVLRLCLAHFDDAGLHKNDQRLVDVGSGFGIAFAGQDGLNYLFLRGLAKALGEGIDMLEGLRRHGPPLLLAQQSFVLLFQWLVDAFMRVEDRGFLGNDAGQPILVFRVLGDGNYFVGLQELGERAEAQGALIEGAIEIEKAVLDGGKWHGSGSCPKNALCSIHGVIYRGAHFLLADWLLRARVDELGAGGFYAFAQW
ncbi:hypothetical protein FQZ97_853880 [compost metagenome]